MRQTTQVLALLTEAYGGWGGIAQFNRDCVSALAGALAGAGGVPIVVVPRYGTADGGLPPGVSQRPPAPARLGYVLTAIRAALTLRPRVILCGHLFMVPLAAMLARLTGAQLVLVLHGIEAWHTPTRLIRRAVAASDLVLSVSRYTRSAVLRWSTLAPERVVVVGNTFDTGFVPVDRVAARARFGLGSGPAILTVGRLDARERYKGHAELIEALADPKLADVTYVVAGDGDDQARLKALAERCGVAERVRFIGRVPAEALPALYSAADLFAMPSTHEGFGIVYLEALACGTPVLGLDRTGTRDALADGALGTLCAPGSLAAALAGALAQDPSHRDGLPAAVRARFGPEQFNRRIVQAFARLKISMPGEPQGAPAQ